MITVIVLMDQVVWRPLIAWTLKFKFEQMEASVTPQSPVLDFLRHSRVLAFAVRAILSPAGEALSRHFARSATKTSFPLLFNVIAGASAQFPQT